MPNVANMSGNITPETGFKTQKQEHIFYVWIFAKIFTRISGGLYYMKECHGGIFGQCHWTGLGLVSVAAQ